MNPTLPSRNGQVVRPVNTGSGEPSTYTRPSMESGTLASRLQAVQLDDAEPDGQMAMALLAAHEQERSRLAEELHDGPAQALANAIFQIEILDRAVREDPAARARRACLAAGDARTRAGHAARLHQPAPTVAERGGRARGRAARQCRGAHPAVGRAGRAAHRRPPATSSSQRPERSSCASPRRRCATSPNTHQRPTRGSPRGRGVSPDGEHQWILEVGDDGRGFDYQAVAAHPNKRHFGLRFMRERADLLGSDLAIQTDPAGTVVRLTIVTTGGERS